MWTYEQFLSTLNRYVHNLAHPVGSMIEAYTIEEAVNCCTKYIRDGRAIGLPIHQHEGRTSRMGCTGREVHTDVLNETAQQAHYNILHQLVVMETYIEKHLDEIHAARDGQCKSSFTTWLQEQDIPHGEVNEVEAVKRLVSGLSTQITTWQGYDINGYRFHTKEKNKKSVRDHDA